MLAAGLLLLGAALPGAPNAAAQSRGEGQSRGAAVELIDQPVLIQSLGMSIRLPVGASYNTDRMTGGQASFSMVASDNTWRMILHSPSSSDLTLNPESVADNLIDELRQSRSQMEQDRRGQRQVGSAVEILDRSVELNINDFPAARFYARIPGNVGGATIVSGYTIFQVGAGRFAILQMDCMEAEYTRARAAYETVVATAEFRDPADMAAERAAGVRAGNALLSSLNRSDLEAALLDQPAFYRLYRPAPTGARADAEEIAYQQIDMRMGRRGELDPRKPVRRWTQADHEPGFIVTIIGRFLDGSRHVDSESIFFLSLDRDAEAWALRMVVREGRSETGWTETGVRSGGDIKVTIDQPGQTPVLKQWRKPAEAYLSQVESYLLPRILAQRSAATIFNFYRYQSSTAEIALRRDILEPLNDADDEDGAWRLRSRPDENSPEEISILSADGELIRRQLANGGVMEPIELEALRRLWKSKDLPLN
ncbi:MAG: hypothetical protein EA376_02790 [Phycisphaeraceae bacterium]|nr:MAG: hypothetical protein EA376_02790 [Phycisphaeraceae bacterium]